jgi:nitrogen regulatory protein PII-like uncharacterized protein
MSLDTKLDLNKFWVSTPTPLKYFLLVAVIIASIYFLQIRQPNKDQLNQLKKIEENIEITQQLIAKFDEFQKFQFEYNTKVANDIEKMYYLISDLNDNTSSKITCIVSNKESKNVEELLYRLKLLDESYSKLLHAYQPNLSKN